MFRLTALLVISAMQTLSVSASTTNAGDYAVIDVIKVGGPGGWDYTTLDPLRRTLYIAHGSAIASVNLATKVANPHWADAQGAHIALPLPDGQGVLITHGKANQVTVNDASTGAVLVAIPVDANPDAAVLEPLTGRAFVMANGAALVDVVNLKTRSVIARIPVGGSPEAAATNSRGLIYTHLEDRNSLVVIDARSLSVKFTFEMSDCEQPSGIAFIADRQWVLSACRNGVARISDAASGAKIASVPIGKGPDFAFYDSIKRLAFVPCRDGTLTVISFSSALPQLRETVTTKAGARTAALDPSTGLIYLPTAELRPSANPEGRQEIVPNTFQVLVVGAR